MIPKFKGKYIQEKKLLKLAGNLQSPNSATYVHGSPRRTNTFDFGSKLLVKLSAVRNFASANQTASQVAAEFEASEQDNTNTDARASQTSEVTPLLDDFQQSQYATLRIDNTRNEETEQFAEAVDSSSPLHRHSLPSALSLMDTERILDEAALSDHCGSFITKFKEETDKVEKFFNEQVDTCAKRMDSAIGHLRTSHGTLRATAGVKEELVEVYRTLHLLESFALVNFSFLMNVLGQPKVKHCVIHLGNSNATASRNVRHVFVRGLLKDHVMSRTFVDRSVLKTTMSKLENVYAMLFHEGQREIARYMLLKKRVQALPWEHVSVAVSVGMSVVLLLWVVNSALWVGEVDSPQKVALAVWGRGGTRVFRVFAELVVLLWTLALLLWTLKQWRVNFMLLFNLPAVKPPKVVSVMRLASHLTVLLLVCALVTIKVAKGQFTSIPVAWAGAVPFAILVSSVVLLGGVALRYVVANWKNLKRNVGAHLWSVVLFATGLSASTFLTAFVTDYLTSSARLMADLCFVGCYLLAEKRPLQALEPGADTWCDTSPVLNSYIVPAVSVWPLAMRLIQNLKQFYHEAQGSPRRVTFILNAAKYALNHTVVIFSVLHSHLMHGDHKSLWEVLFFCSFALASFVAWLWDVLMDWGLGDPKHGMLRPTLMCTYPVQVYYWAIVLDFFFRFVWATTLIPSESLPAQIMNFPLILTFIELFRRSVWAAFRCENEHLNNTRGYRSDNVFVPLYFDTPLLESDENNAGSLEDGSNEENAGSAKMNNRCYKWLSLIEVGIMVTLVVGLGVAAAVL